MLRLENWPRPKVACRSGGAARRRAADCGGAATYPYSVTSVFTPEDSESGEKLLTPQRYEKRKRNQSIA